MDTEQGGASLIVAPEDALNAGPGWEAFPMHYVVTGYDPWGAHVFQLTVTDC